MRMSAIAVAMLVAKSLGAQTIGMVSLRLGEPQASALAKLSQYYTLDSSIAVTGVWGVDERGTSPSNSLGAVAFREGRLFIVGRSWEPDSADTQSFAITVIRALARLETESPCRVAHNGQSSPNGNAFEDVEVDCGNHWIRISTTKVRGRQTQQINESWQADSSRPKE